MWGQVVYDNSVIDIERIIPTRVGTRKSPLDKFERVKDHPHACGDKACSHEGYAILLGSSPRVWGQVAVFLFALVARGIIPTRVGTSCTYKDFTT